MTPVSAVDVCTPEEVKSRPGACAPLAVTVTASGAHAPGLLFTSSGVQTSTADTGVMIYDDGVRGGRLHSRGGEEQARCVRPAGGGRRERDLRARRDGAAPRRGGDLHGRGGARRGRLRPRGGTAGEQKSQSQRDGQAPAQHIHEDSDDKQYWSYCLTGLTV